MVAQVYHDERPLLRVIEPRANCPEYERIAEYEARLLATFGRATRDDVAAGVSWYPDAADYCRDIAAGTRYSFEQVAACLVVLSAQTAWQSNKHKLRLIVERHAAGTLPDRHIPGIFASGGQIRQCGAILGGAYGTTVEDLRPRICGRGYYKTMVFFLNVCGQYDRACMDTHMARACLGTRPGDGTPAPHGRQYQAMEQACLNVAARVGMPAALVQAAVWIVQRGGAE